MICTVSSSQPILIDNEITYDPRSDRRDLLAIQVKSVIFTEKDLAVVNNYRKFEEIVFTNNKDMSVWTGIDDAF